MRKSTPDEVQCGLADVSDLSLRDLDEHDPSALVVALQELLEPDRRDGDPVAGFASYTDYES